MSEPTYRFTVPEQKRIRVIVNTDAKNEADDQYAVVHALLTPRLDIRGVIGAHFGQDRSPTSMQDSCDEIAKVLDLMGIDDDTLVYRGASHGVRPGDEMPTSAGSDLIIEEAMRSDARPLFAIFLGPLTDLAVAVTQEPRIRDRLTAIWIGGGPWPDGGWEFNLMNDVRAANIVFESGINLWQVPQNVYSMMRVSLAELQIRVMPMGDLGRYLFEQMIDVNNLHADNLDWPPGESWVLGDSPAVGLLIDEHRFCYSDRPAPAVDDQMAYVHGRHSHTIRVYESIDSRFILEDFYSKLAIHYG